MQDSLADISGASTSAARLGRENHSVAGVHGSFAYMLGSIAGIYGSFADISGACTSVARLIVEACFENHFVEEYEWLFYVHIGLFCEYIGLVYLFSEKRESFCCRSTWLFCVYVGLYCGYVWLFCGYIGLLYLFSEKATFRVVEACCENASVAGVYMALSRYIWLFRGYIKTFRGCVLLFLWIYMALLRVCWALLRIYRARVPLQREGSVRRRRGVF